jgi:hypothetical protein
MKKNQVREHHIEHAFASVEDHLKTVIAKIEKRGGDSDVRIEDLEAVPHPSSPLLSHQRPCRKLRNKWQAQSIRECPALSGS